MIISENFTFIHLPKTGGTFAQKMILDSYKNLNLFDNIKLLMAPSIEAKNIAIEFNVASSRLELDIDTYLIVTRSCI